MHARGKPLAARRRAGQWMLMAPDAVETLGPPCMALGLSVLPIVL